MKMILEKIQNLSAIKTRRIDVYIFFFLSLIVIGATCFLCIQNGMHVSTQESLHLYFAKYLGVAISNLEHHAGGFVGFNNIYQLLLKHGTIDDQILKEALTLKDVQSGGLYKISAMDLGYSTYAKYAFLLFGYRVQSLLFFYFTILIFSFLVFFLEFRKQKIMLLSMLLLLLAHHLVALRSIDMQYNVGVIFGFRFMSLLAVLPLIHLYFFIFSGKTIERKNLFSLFLLLFQTLIIIEMIFIRSSTQWMLIATMGIIPIIFCYSYFFNRALLIKNFFHRSLPIILVFALFIICKTVQHRSTDELYQKGKEGSHVFWHSLYVGLALNPEIRAEYTAERVEGDFKNESWITSSKYRPNDQDAYSATFKWLQSKNQDEFAVLNFSPEDNVQYRGIFTYWNHRPYFSETGIFNRKIDMDADYNWNAADLALREIVQDVLKKHPVLVLKTIFIIKPLKFINIYLEDFLKWRNLKKVETIFSLSHLLIIFIFCSAFYLCRQEIINLSALLFPFIYVTLFSLIIPFVVYPEPWTIGDQSVFLTVILFLSLAVLIAKFLKFPLLKRLKFN